MIKNQHLYSLLHKKFHNTAFQIYYYQNIQSQHQLLLEHGNMRKKYDLLSLPYTNEKITIYKDEAMTLLCFTYSDDHKILLCLSSTNIDFSIEDLETLYVIFSYLQMETKMQAKEDEISSMIESIRSVTSSLELKDVLNNIIFQALSVIQAADAGYLLLYDEISHCLTPKVAIGFNDNLYEIKMKIGESITGKVFKESEAVIYYSRSDIYKGMKDISEQNFHYIQSSIDFLKLKSMICVPLLLGEKKIGVMTVQQHNAKGQMCEEDLRLLQGFAVHAVIAINNARLFEQANNRLEEITKLTQQLEKKNELLSRRAVIHEMLTQFSLQNKSLESIIQELNRIMNKELFFYDHLDSQLFPKKKLNYPYLSNDECSWILRTYKKPFFINIVDKQDITYYIYPILSNHVTLGCFILPFFSPISAHDKMTIEQACSILALELTKRKTQAEVYYKKTQELFTELLQFNEPRVLEKHGESLGFNRKAFFTILLLEVSSDSEKDFQASEAFIHRLISNIKQVIPEQGSMIFGFHNKVTILLSAIDPMKISQFMDELQALIFKLANREEMNVYGGLSTQQLGIPAIQHCYKEALKTLSYALNQKKSGIMNYKKIGIDRLFLSQTTTEIENYSNDILSPLKSEKSRNNDLEKTLYTYVSLNKSVNETAKKLHIHKNTLYHRIKLIEELLQLKLNHPDDFLQILLACHLQGKLAKPIVSL
ncbi:MULTISPECIES: helix-turn-helix domain-containing protein [Bacillus]|uniref:helix-turn-helix domain-containing protein n=1 Tax=Bacillus TaxID=1386 RepID=UPI0002E1614C|nr:MULTISPECIES: helix-turn-helix domain-containing protein [Bacillus]